MTISNEILENLFADFTEFVSTKDKVPFSTFNSSKYFDNQEKYKEAVYKEARETINNGRWKQEDIGTGKIYKTIVDAIKDKVIYKYEQCNNNLINFWTIRDDFKKYKPSKSFEQLLFDFYKSKGIKNDTVFEELLKYGHPYNLIAYLFFIKDNKQFLPISQRKFDRVFIDLGINDFKTDGSASYENYSTFIVIIKEVHKFLKTKDKEASLLDSHSFLWILGDQMKEEKFISSRHNVVPAIENQVPISQTDLRIPIEIEPEQTIAEEDDELAFPEGKEVFRLHKSKERNKELIRVAKQKRLLTDKKLCCQVCNFSFTDKYGELGSGFIEAHHLFPISQLIEETETKIDDLALVCSNCHRMLHRRRPWLTLDELKTILR
jgi:predicted HNH restriction endonuclease